MEHHGPAHEGAPDLCAVLSGGGDEALLQGSGVEKVC